MIRSIFALIFYIVFILGIVMVCEKVDIIKEFICGSKKSMDSGKSFKSKGQYAADLYKKRGF